LSSIGRAPARKPAREAPDSGVGEPGFSMEQFERPPSFLPHLRLLWENRKLILRTGFYSLLASALIALIIPVRFRSVTRLMPPDTAPSSLGMLASMATGAGAAALGGIAGDLLGMKSSGALFVGILQSETVQDGLIAQFNLQKVYGAKKIEDARKDLAAHTEISEDRKSGIISISVTDHDPKRAAAMAQTYVQELNRLVAQVSTSSARRERIFLEGRLKAVKAELDNSAKSFSEFASKNTAIDIPAQGKAMVEAAATLQGELIAAQSQLQGLKQIYTDNNVRVRAMQARVDELNKKLNEIGGAGTPGNASSGNSLYPSIRKLPLLGVTYADLYRQTKIDETVYGLLTQQYELAKVEEAKEIPTVKVLDPALVPTKKSFPPRTIITILGTLLGIAVAMTWVLGKAQWEAVDAADPRKEFAIEVFTTMRANLPKFARNGSSSSPNGHWPGSWWKKPTSVGKDESVRRSDTVGESGAPGAIKHQDENFDEK
jgi:capsule polysaccharide export protein KpsE/RkpR